MANVYNTLTHKQWDHTGFIFPEVEAGDSHYGIGEFKPANWLHVVRYEKKMENWIVIMPGKAVAVSRDGDIVPAGLKVSWDVAAGSTALSYTSDDYDNGVVDLTTGVAYATNGTTNYTQTQLTAALKARGKIRATELAHHFISAPVGYAPYAMLQWCGGDGFNPVNYRQHNYNMQHAVNFGCDHVLQVPLVPATETTETMGDGSISSSAITFGTTQFVDSTGLAATTRYSSDVSAGDNVVAYVFAKYPVAKQVTNQTTFTCTGISGLSETTSIANVKANSSTYYVDYDAGVMFLYEAGGNAVPSTFTDGVTTITYYNYEDAATGNANLAMALGDLYPGDFVTMDSNSNWIKAHIDIGTAPASTDGHYSSDPTYDGGDDAAISLQLEATIEEAVFRTLGQVVAVIDHPKSAVDRVKTQYTALTATERMPGTATQGMTDALNLAGGANKMVFINFLAR